MTQDRDGGHSLADEESLDQRESDTSPTSLSRDVLNFQLPIRWRLTIWYAGSLCLLLVGFSGLVWAMTNSWLLSQVDLELTEELAELQESIDSSSDETTLQENVDGWSQLHEPYGFDFEIRTEDGALLMRSQRLTQVGESLDTGTAPVETVYSHDLPKLGRLRVKETAITMLGHQRRLWIAVTEAEQQRLLDRLGMVLLIAGVVVMAGAAGGGYFLSRRALRPVDEITATAAMISANRLSNRIVVENPHDELGRLALTLNTMLDRLDGSFAELKRFTADAAHELRTPLTLLRNELEVCLRKSRSADDYEQTVRSALDDTQRMCRLTEQLLDLARGDSNSQTANDPVPLAALMKDVVSQLDSNARLADVTIELDGCLKCAVSTDEGEELSLVNGVAISGDCIRLRRLLFNLLDNAVKYSPNGGHIRIYAETINQRVRIIVEDSGCGISPNHLPHIFDRFYRVDGSRASTTGGTGLGLAICRSIVEAHGGIIDITSEPGRGTQVTVSLPLFEEAKDESPEMADETLKSVI